MTSTRLDRALIPLLLISMSGAIAVGLVLIWFELENRTLFKLLGSFGAIALASGFVLSATRLGGSGVRRDA
jgi:hypothetical protein